MIAAVQTWEHAVRWYRAQPGQEAAIAANYFDLPVQRAAERYAASEEFAEVRRLLGEGNGRRILDLGAGNGIASFALAKAGWRVSAFEPDPSEEVGAGAIRALARSSGLAIEVQSEPGGRLPYEDAAFDAIHARQVLHHVPSVAGTMHDLHRILRSGGRVLATREHVAADKEELADFLARHPLHHLYGGENAHPLATYLKAATTAGFRVKKVWGHLESVLNFHPGSERERRALARAIAARRFGGVGRLFALFPGFVARSLALHTAADRTPGRLYAFLFVKP